MTNFQWWADQMPPGQFLCQVCFEGFPASEASEDAEGVKWDICKGCKAHEQEVLRRRREG